MINYMQPTYDEMEINAVCEYMNSGAWLTEFTKTREFERQIAAYTGSDFCSVMSNGTVTLIAALMACGIKPGDEVIVPGFTMAATSHAVEILGAKAVFTDIERDTLCIDYNHITAAVTKKTKAVIMVHLNGRYPSRFIDIIEYCRTNQLWLIEDAAQALGSVYEGRALGTFGDIGSYSFSMPKIITTGQGGAVVTNNRDLYDKIVRIRDFGREKAGADHYVTIGANFKYTDIQAVIGIEQLKKLDERLREKKRICKHYDDLLSNINEIEIINNNYDDVAPCFYEILCDGRDELAEFLRDRDIRTRKFYPPLHSEPAYNRSRSFPVAEEISGKGLWLPSFVTLKDEEIEFICTCIKEFYN